MRKTTFWKLAILGFVGIPFLGFLLLNELVGYSFRASKIGHAERDLLAIHGLLKKYAVAAGRPPATSQGMEALVEEPKSGPQPKAWVQILKRTPQDPWGMPYRYTLINGKEGEWRWEVRSAGPDEIFGNEDDIAGEAEGTLSSK